MQQRAANKLEQELAGDEPPISGWLILLAGLLLVIATGGVVWLTGRWQPGEWSTMAGVVVAVGVSLLITARVCSEAGTYFLNRSTMFCAGLLAAMALLVGVSQWAEPRYIAGNSVNNLGYGSDAKSIFDVIEDFTSAAGMSDAAKMEAALDGKNAPTPAPHTGTGDPLDDAVDGAQQINDAAMSIADTAKSGAGAGASAALNFADRTKQSAGQPGDATAAHAESTVQQSLPGPVTKIQPVRIWWSLDAAGLRVAGLDVSREVTLSTLTKHWGKPDAVQRAGNQGDCWLTWTELDIVAFARRTETGGMVSRIGYYPETGERHMLKVAGERFQPKADTDAFVGGVRLRRFVTQGKPLVIFDLAQSD